MSDRAHRPSNHQAGRPRSSLQRGLSLGVLMVATVLIVGFAKAWHSGGVGSDDAVWVLTFAGVMALAAAANTVPVRAGRAIAPRWMAGLALALALGPAAWALLIEALLVGGDTAGLVETFLGYLIAGAVLALIAAVQWGWARRRRSAAG